MTRRILAAMQARGGQAAIRDLKAIDYNAKTYLSRLMKQGYVERVSRGLYRLTKRGCALRGG